MFNILRKFFMQPDSRQLAEAIENGAFLVDVRTPREFAGGSVTGAVNIPLDRLSTQLQQLADASSIVVFCRSGGRSSQAKSILEQNGIKNVLNGGTWQNVSRLVGQ